MGTFDHAIARLPRWILGLAAAGTVISGILWNLAVSGGFLLGALGAYLNFLLIERAANRITRTSRADKKKPGTGTGVWILIQYAGLILVVFVILRYSGFRMAAAFCGFLVCPAAVVLELVYELLTLNFKNDHT